MAITVRIELRTDELKRKMKFGAYRGVVDALSIGYREARKLLSASDHTMKDLRDMGHPYAVRAPANPHDPPVAIHEQSGAYLAALRITNPTGLQGSIIGGSVRNDDRKDEWLQRGTSTMIARPWAQYIETTYAQEMRDIVLARIADALR